MRTTQVISHFASMHPGIRIYDAVLDGDRRITFTIRKRDAINATPGDPCQCTIARGCRRETDASEALILTTVAYLLEPLGKREYVLVKYLHDGQQVVKNTDSGGYPVWNTVITLRPPSSQRRVGVQTPAQKARQSKSRKQTADHIARRVESARMNPARARMARVGGL